MDPNTLIAKPLYKPGIPSFLIVSLAILRITDLDKNEPPFKAV